MFKSGLTKGIYASFLKDHRLEHSELLSAPFIYVDPKTSQVKLLTSVINNKEHNDEFLALSVANDGDIEVVSTEQDF